MGMPGLSRSCTATFKIYCASPSASPFINPTLLKKRTTFHGSHPGDETADKLLPHTHIGFVWLIHLLYATFAN